MSEYFIGISISELQQWLADDELPVLTDRITHSRKPLDASSSGSELESLFKSLPPFSLDDQAGVLIVEISGPDTWRADDDPGIRYLALSKVNRFIPLTEDTKLALSVHWSGVIELSAAIFEREFTYFRISRKSISARTAGNLFANLFIDHGPEGFAASGLFVDSLPCALMAAEHRKLDEIEKLRDWQNNELTETWVERVFGDIKKHDKENKLGNLKNIPDNLRGISILGVLFSTVEAMKAFTVNFRSVYSRLKETTKGHDQSLALIYANSELSQLKASFFVNQQGSETVSLVTLGLFLRWKQAFFDQRSTVNTQLILDDVNSLAGFVEVDLVTNALWMMGAYLGMEYIAPTYRHLHQEKYRALRFAGSETSLRPVAAWQLKVTKQPEQHELASGSGSDSGTAITPEYESALEIKIETNEARQLEQQKNQDVPETKPTESDQERATDGDKQSNDTSSSSEPSSASHISVTPEDAQTQQSHKVVQTDNAVIRQPERMTENLSASSAAEHGVLEVAKTFAAGSIHVADDIQQAASSVPTVSEGITDAGSVESLKGTTQANPSSNKSPRKKPPINKLANTIQSSIKKNKASPIPTKSIKISTSESVSSVETAKPKDNQEERVVGSESGKNVKTDSLF